MQYFTATTKWNVISVAFTFVFQLGLSGIAAHAQELGDADGDGRLTVGDVHLLVVDETPAPGSI